MRALTPPPSRWLASASAPSSWSALSLTWRMRERRRVKRLRSMLDFWNGLRKGIDAALDTGSIATVNAALRERFTAFHIAVGEDGTIAITPELPPESPAVVVWDSPDGERPASNDPAAWAAFYRENPPTAARLVTFDNGGEGERFPALIDPSQNSRNAQP